VSRSKPRNASSAFVMRNIYLTNMSLKMRLCTMCQCNL
jgi:hypothetical protein